MSGLEAAWLPYSTAKNSGLIAMNKASIGPSAAPASGQQRPCDKASSIGLTPCLQTQCCAGRRVWHRNLHIHAHRRPSGDSSPLLRRTAHGQVAIPVLAIVIGLDLLFVSSNALKFIDGGWVPIAVAILLYL